MEKSDAAGRASEDRRRERDEREAQRWPLVLALTREAQRLHAAVAADRERAALEANIARVEMQLASVVEFPELRKHVRSVA